ncbi:aminotransferase class IV [Streptomyces xiamenensis]|uniref:aminotransferase class IV n=1 Tax=Streptomyces xiamenensis TaxID=408015 RepID=UPI0037D92A79
MTSSFHAVHRGGRAASAGDLAPLAFAGYAHFTALQVREGRARGPDLHLERLRGASVHLFGRALPDERVRDALQAVAAGFDDAAFTDRRGRLSEATIWNLAFWDGSAVVWPKAELLTGTTMGIVRRRLEGLGVPQRVREVTVADVPSLAGAVVMNSWTPGVPVHAIGPHPVPAAPDFVALLRRAYEAEPLVAL